MFECHMTFSLCTIVIKSNFFCFQLWFSFFLPTDGAVGGEEGSAQPSEDQLEEPVVKKQRTEE